MTAHSVIVFSARRALQNQIDSESGWHLRHGFTTANVDFLRLAKIAAGGPPTLSRRRRVIVFSARRALQNQIDSESGLALETWLHNRAGLGDTLPSKSQGQWERIIGGEIK